MNDDYKVFEPHVDHVFLRVECPNCGYSLNTYEKPRYCPHCGRYLSWDTYDSYINKALRELAEKQKEEAEE